MSYFPGDIPFMSKEELRENGIKIPKDATETNAGDTISRQATIDAILGQPPEPHYPSWYAEQIKQLPPAQPEPNYDEWCTDCKEYDHENSCCHRWTKVIRQTRRELQDEFVMTAVDGTLWVTVDDVQKVGRVIVDEEKSKFCRQFYMEEEQRTGKWIKITKGAMREKYMCSVCGRTIEEDGIERLVPIKYPFCHCGAKMEGANNETD